MYVPCGCLFSLLVSFHRCEILGQLLQQYNKMSFFIAATRILLYTIQRIEFNDCNIIIQQTWSIVILMSLSLYRHGHPNEDSHSTMLLLENLQFLCNHYETWSKCGSHQLLIYTTKFRNDCIKNCGFFNNQHNIMRVLIRVPMSV